MLAVTLAACTAHENFECYTTAVLSFLSATKLLVILVGGFLLGILAMVIYLATLGFSVFFIEGALLVVLVAAIFFVCWLHIE
jgi:hypothetical protein